MSNFFAVSFGTVMVFMYFSCARGFQWNSAFHTLANNLSKFWSLMFGCGPELKIAIPESSRPYWQTFRGFVGHQKETALSNGQMLGMLGILRISRYKKIRLKEHCGWTMEKFQLVTLDHKKVATRIRVPNTRLLIQGFHWVFHNVDPIIRIYIFDEIRILWLLLLADRSLVYWLPQRSKKWTSIENWPIASLIWSLTKTSKVLTQN